MISKIISDNAALRTVAIGGPQPPQETEDEGSYPLLRPLLIYIVGSLFEKKLQLLTVIICYLRTVKDVIVNVSCFRPREAVFQNAVRRFARALNNERDAR